MAGNRKSEVTAAESVYICHGGKHDFTIKAEAGSPWIKQGVSLNRNPADPELPITTSPHIAHYQIFPEEGVTWTIDCPYQPADAEVKAFQLWVQTEFTSPAYKFGVFAGHFRVEFDEMTGDEQFQVIEFNETSTLMAREISYYTREAMPFEVQWRLDDENLGPATPGADGRVSLDFKKTTAGSYPVRVVVPSLYYESGITEYAYDVRCLELTPWGNDVLLQVNAKTETDVLERGVVCTRGTGMGVKLLNENMLLKDSTVSLKSMDAKGLGIVFHPDLDTERSMEEGELEWLLAIVGGKSGLFKLQMHCSKLKKDWDITGHVVSADLKDEVEKIQVNGSELSDFGAVFFRNETRPLTVTFAESMRGLTVALEETGTPGMTYDPPLKTYRKVPENLKLEWQVTGGDSSAVFALQVVCADVATPLVIESRVLSKITTEEIQSLKINGDAVDLTQPELFFFRAGTFAVELIPKPASSLIGLNVALKKGSGPELGMAYNPPLEQPRALTATGLQWTVTGGASQSGLFELLIDVPQVEQSMPLTCRLLSSNLTDEAVVKISGVEMTPEGNWFIRDKAQTVTLTPKLGSPLAGFPVSLTCTIKSGLNPDNVVSEPTFGSEQKNHNWVVRGNTNSGVFQLILSGKGMTAPITVAVSKLISSNLADEVLVKVGDKEVPINGVVFYKGKMAVIKLVPKPNSPFSGVAVWMVCTVNNPLSSTDVMISPPPEFGQKVTSWEFVGRKNGSLKLSFVGDGMTTPLTLEGCKIVDQNS